MPDAISNQTNQQLPPSRRPLPLRWWNDVLHLLLVGTNPRHRLTASRRVRNILKSPTFLVRLSFERVAAAAVRQTGRRVEAFSDSAAAGTVLTRQRKTLFTPQGAFQGGKARTEESEAEIKTPGHRREGYRGRNVSTVSHQGRISACFFFFFFPGVGVGLLTCDTVFCFVLFFFLFGV